MNAHSVRRNGLRLADIYPPFKEKMDEYMRWAPIDPEAADRVFREAQDCAKAFYADTQHGIAMR